MNEHRNPLCGSITEKIGWAESVHHQFGSSALRDPAVRELLEALGDAIRVSRQANREVGFEDVCRACDQTEGGSCCGAGLEHHYDGWLLLINRLMGVDLPQTRFDPRSCSFLGPAGCTLKARQVICINYMCPKAAGLLDPAKVNFLREREAREIDILFALNEHLKLFLRPMLRT